jgi:hypothetical protein
MKKFTKQIKILLKIMRFSLYQILLILFCATFAIAHKNHGQECLNQKIVLHLENKPLDMALRQIKKNASVSFVYSPQLIGSERNVTIVAQVNRLKYVLFKLLAPLGIDYEVSGTTIILSKANKSLFSSMLSLRPMLLDYIYEKSVTGLILDEKTSQCQGSISLSKEPQRGIFGCRW